MTHTAKIFKADYSNETAEFTELANFGEVKCAADVILSLNSSPFSAHANTIMSMVKYFVGNYTVKGLDGELHTLVVKKSK